MITGYDTSIQTKTKTVEDYHVTLSEAKQQLRVDSTLNYDDARINQLIKASVDFVASRTNGDVGQTKNVLTLTNFTGDSLIVYDAPFLSILGLSGDNGSQSYTLEYVKYNRFLLEFPQELQESTLTLEYKTGFATGQLPEAIRQAILLQINSFYDEISGEYVMGTWKENYVIDKLIDRYKIIHV